ncbi:MAG: class I SAM-dependent methyltransferase [bacterium]|nr:class I SAM-dependent methyltransferase [bacterium]
MQKLKTITRKTCRLCGGSDFKKVLSLGSLYVSNFVKKRDEGGIKAPLDLILCKNPKCELLQLRHTAPQEIMYSRHYWYKSAISPVIKADLKEIANQVIKMVDMKKGDVFLDIGANDGTLFDYVSKSFTRVGCEPANNLQKDLKKRADYVIHDFWTEGAYNKLKLPRAKVVTAIGMFYDMEDPGQFVRDAGRVMADDGIFIAQLMTLKPMIVLNDVSNICHEHIEFYSYPSLVYLFEKNGLEIFKVEENSINGGSYRLFARKLRKGSIKYKEPKLDYKAFAKRIESNKKKCVDFIRQEVKKGKVVYGYGASTKGNTILQYYGLGSKDITAIADKSPEKWGKYTVGTMIPIVSEEKARKANPDYFFILPYAFVKTFVEREKAWTKRGGKFIVSIPKFKVIRK